MAANIAGVFPNRDQAEAAPVASLGRVQPGFDVYSSDGQIVGTVQDASAECVHVLCCSNLFVPPSRVERVERDRVVLNVPFDQLDNVDWSTCAPSPAATYQVGGPGVSGVPPQVHEAGVDTP